LTDEQGGGVLIDNFAAMFLTDPSDPYSCANGDPKCVVINPFGLGALTKEMVDYYNVDLVNHTRVRQTQIGGTISGSLFSLPAGDVGIAVGVEYRKESARFQPDQLYVLGEAISRSAGLQPTGGSYDVAEAFGELYVPILANRPGFELLAFEGGIRVSHYSTAGSVVSYKIDRKSTRLNSSHVEISYAVFCLKKKTQQLAHLRAGALEARAQVLDAGSELGA